MKTEHMAVLAALASGDCTMRELRKGHHCSPLAVKTLIRTGLVERNGNQLALSTRGLVAYMKEQHVEQGGNQ